MTWQERNKELLQRMSEDLALRNLSASTVKLYTDHVRRFGEVAFIVPREVRRSLERPPFALWRKMKSTGWNAGNETATDHLCRLHVRLSSRRA